MVVKVSLLKAFGVDENGGNPAGVVLNAEGLTDIQKKFISKEVGFSETAFVEKSDKANFKVSFFTPTDEVDMCGHATIATYSLMFQKGFAAVGKYTQEIKAGLLGISITNNGTIVMEQTSPIYSEFISEEEIKSVFGNVEYIQGLLPEVVSTGLRDILLPVSDREQLFALKPNFKAMSELNRKTNSIGVHAFTLQTIDPKAIAHCRNFAPLYGIEEECATGSSNGALASYLFKNDKLPDTTSDLKFEQGYSMGKPSEILVNLESQDNNITKVSVGGKAIIFGEREIEVSS